MVDAETLVWIIVFEPVVQICRRPLIVLKVQTVEFWEISLLIWRRETMRREWNILLILCSRGMKFRANGKNHQHEVHKIKHDIFNQSRPAMMSYPTRYEPVTHFESRYDPAAVPHSQPVVKPTTNKKITQANDKSSIVFLWLAHSRKWTFLSVVFIGKVSSYHCKELAF